MQWKAEILIVTTHTITSSVALLICFPATSEQTFLKNEKGTYLTVAAAGPFVNDETKEFYINIIVIDKFL